MKLYHGSPKELKIIKIYKAKGIGEFQNQEAVYLTKNYETAALYALGKSLKGRTAFAITPRGKIIIVGEEKPSIKGWVYEVEIPEEEIIQGEHGEYEYSTNKEIKEYKKYKVRIEDYDKRIIRVKTKEEMMKKIKEIRRK